MDLREVDLTGANLMEADLHEASLSSVNLTRANLAGANLNDARLYNVRLSGANLHVAHLRSAELHRVDLSDADLSKADLSAMELEETNLSGANLSSTDLRGARLGRANLTNANLTNANLTTNHSTLVPKRVDLSGANLAGAKMLNANLGTANLTGANLSEADLSDADLSGANLSGANLSGANLSWADLTGACVDDANLSGTNLSNVIVSGASLLRLRGDYAFSVSPWYRPLRLIRSMRGPFGVLCGVGGGVAAVVAVGWWYVTQPDGVVLDGESVTINGTSSARLPAAAIHRRFGDTVPARMPLSWRVEPPGLAAIEGDRIMPREPGSGEVRACLGQLCDSAALTVAMVDSISTNPTKTIGFRLWTPRAIEAAARWKGEPVPVPIMWSTADHAVATVSDTGVVTPVAPGSTELRIEAGGVVTTLTVKVHPEPPADCTLPKYADLLGRTGRKVEHRKCQSEAQDFCEWDSKQPLVGGGTVIEGGGWEWGWATLELPGVDAGEAWNIARRCMELPPEVAALDLPALLRERRAVTKVVPLAGDWDGEPQATIKVTGGKAQIALPSACYSDRTFSVDRAGVVTLGVSAGC